MQRQKTGIARQEEWKMKKGIGLLVVWIGLLIASAALGDGYSKRCFSSVFKDDIRLASYAGSYSKYVSVDGCGATTNALSVTVISKSASVWTQPRTNSKRIATVKNGETLACVTDQHGLIQDGSFYRVRYNGQEGFINEDYVVAGTLEIVLMESNVPAYIAPTSASKKVGSLAKGTRYRVIGFYDDYYIVLLRNAAAAFIPMDTAHYDTYFEAAYRQAKEYKGVTNGKTDIRTGPGKEYAVYESVKAGYTFDYVDKLDDWYMLRYRDGSTDGEVFAFIGRDAAEVFGF